MEQKNKKIAIITVGFVAIGLGIFLMSQNSQENELVNYKDKEASRIIASVQAPPIQKNVSQAKKPLKKIELSKEEIAKEMVKLQLPEEDIKSNLYDMGFEKVSVSYDQYGVATVEAEGKTYEPEDLEEELSYEWNEHEEELLSEINGEDYTPTAQDQEMIAQWRDSLDY